MPSRSWEDLVADGVRLLHEDPIDRWALADLAVEVAPPGTGKAAASANQATLSRFASAVGWNINSLKAAYDTGRRWPRSTRIAGVSFGKHANYRARKNRVMLMLNSGLDPLPAGVRDRVDKAEECLADPVVRRALIERSKTRRTQILTVVRTFEEEERAKAQVAAKAELDRLKFEERGADLASRIPSQSIHANKSLARMTSELLHLQDWAVNVPEDWQHRSIENAEHVRASARQLLDILRPPDPVPPLHRNAGVIAANAKAKEPDSRGGLATRGPAKRSAPGTSHPSV